MEKMSALVKSGLVTSSQKRLPFCKVKNVLRLLISLKNYFSFNDVVPEPVRSYQILNFTCRSCIASYIGKTFRHLKVMISEHQGVSPGGNKHLKESFPTSVRGYMLYCNRLVV